MTFLKLLANYLPNCDQILEVVDSSTFSKFGGRARSIFTCPVSTVSIRTPEEILRKIAPYDGAVVVINVSPAVCRDVMSVYRSFPENFLIIGDDQLYENIGFLFPYKKEQIGSMLLFRPENDPNQLLTYKWIGKNSGDRQRIKQKRERYISNISKLPKHERSALLQELFSKFH